MDYKTVLADLVYVATAYVIAYLLYLLVKQTRMEHRLGMETQPYDVNRLVLRRKYV